MWSWNRNSHRPSLSGILLAFVGALFVVAAITDACFVIEPFVIPFHYLDKSWDLHVWLPRRDWIMFASAPTGLCFFLSIHYCIRSQLAYYVSTRPHDYPDVTPPKTEDEQKIFILHTNKWNEKRFTCSIRGINCYQTGLYFMLLPIVFVLAAVLVPFGLLTWLILLVFLAKSWHPTPKKPDA